MSWLKNLLTPLSKATSATTASTIKLAHPGAFIENQTEISLRDWLPRFRPSERLGRYLSSDLSMHQVPHFWIITKQESTSNIEMDSETFVLEGEILAQKLTDEIALAKPEDASIRKELHDRFNSQLEELCLRTNVRTGKWLIYLPLETVDAAFDSISLSLGLPLEGGKLSTETSAHTFKITTNPKPINVLGDKMMYEAHLHCEESFDKEDLKRMARILKGFGVLPFGYECDANTLLSLHPGHPSQIPSPRYRISDFLTPEEISETFNSSSSSNKKAEEVQAEEISKK